MTAPLRASRVPHPRSGRRATATSVALMGSVALMSSVALMGSVALVATATVAQASPQKGPTASASPSSAAAAPLHWTTIHLAGTRGTLSWNVAIPRFFGSSAAANANRRVRASAVSSIDATARDAASNVASGDSSHETLDGVSSVTRNDGRTVQVLIALDDDMQGAAHPDDAVNTVVVAVRSGQPITLDQVFTHPISAYRVLGPQVERLAARADQPVTDPSGLTPTTSNWAAWQSTPRGMEFEFQDYQLGGHGTRSYTVPWSIVVPLMTPSARSLLAPSTS